MPRRPGWQAYVHFRAISCRCQRSNVSGVAIVAISRKAVRPTRYARAASRRRSSSVRRRRWVPSWRRRSRFSSIRYVSLPLPAVQPAGQHAQHDLQRRGVNHRVELTSRAVLKTSAESWNTTGVVGEHGGAAVLVNRSGTARVNLIREADALPPRAWTRLVRRPTYEVHSEPQQRPANVKEAVIG
jgi:hypothetical protein